MAATTAIGQALSRAAALEVDMTDQARVPAGDDALVQDLLDALDEKQLLQLGHGF